MEGGLAFAEALRAGAGFATEAEADGDAEVLGPPLLDKYFLAAGFFLATAAFFEVAGDEVADDLACGAAFFAGAGSTASAAAAAAASRMPMSITRVIL